MSRLTYLLSLLTDLLRWSGFVSFEKWWTLQNFKAWFKSLIYIRNDNGLKNDPWGTPNFTSASLES